ncbi:hypothetical protein SSS_10047, partial [Sarcoptes scabiei]
MIRTYNRHINSLDKKFKGQFFPDLFNPKRSQTIYYRKLLFSLSLSLSVLFCMKQSTFFDSVRNNRVLRIFSLFSSTNFTNFLFDLIAIEVQQRLCSIFEKLIYSN